MTYTILQVGKLQYIQENNYMYFAFLFYKTITDSTFR